MHLDGNTSYSIHYYGEIKSKLGVLKTRVPRVTVTKSPANKQNSSFYLYREDMPKAQAEEQTVYKPRHNITRK